MFWSRVRLLQTILENCDCVGEAKINENVGDLSNVFDYLSNHLYQFPDTVANALLSLARFSILV